MKYLRYLFKNTEPLRIADDSTSQSGQTNTLRYIPGSTVRGLVIGKLAVGADFEKNKKLLFSDKIRFMNAYLYENGRELIPSPKGFYEDKTDAEEKAIQNVVIKGDFSDGYKRASLGRYCYIENGCIYYYSVDTGSDMKIQINQGDKQNVFRNEYISAGHAFVGYIAIDADDEALANEIDAVFDGGIILGNARSQGLGKCEILEHKFVTELPYQAYAETGDVSDFCYMMMLSDTAMRGENGESIGINAETLRKKLDVPALEINLCSTSTVNVRGYNRQWGVKIPSVTMYELGSVFKLEFPGQTVSSDKLQEIMMQGLGIRRNEGFGQVLFLKDYEQIDRKKECRRTSASKETALKLSGDEETLKIAAGNYYRHVIERAMEEKILSGDIQLNVTPSQIGNVRAQLENNRYNTNRSHKENGTEIIKKYFEHAQKKEEKQNIQKEKKSIAPFAKKIIEILDSPLQKTLGMAEDTEVMTFAVKDLLSEEELQRMKFDFILKVMKSNNRKGAQ